MYVCIYFSGERGDFSHNLTLHNLIITSEGSITVLSRRCARWRAEIVGRADIHRSRTHAADDARVERHIKIK